MKVYEVFTKNNPDNFGNIYNEDILDTLHLDADNPTDITYTRLDITSAFVLRHGDKRLIELPEWVEARYTESPTEMQKYQYWCSQHWKIFSNNMIHQLQCMYKAIMTEYNPLENYDRHELFTDTDSGSDTLEYKGSVSLEKSGTVQNTRSDSDVLSYDGSEKISNTDVLTKTNTGTQSVDFLGSETSSENGTETNTTDSTNTTTFAGKETNKETGTDSTENTYTDGTVYRGQESERDIGSDVSTKNGKHTDSKTDTHSEKAFNDTDSFTATTKDVSENTSQDTNVKESVDRDSTKTKTFTDRQDETSHTGTETRTANLTNEKSFDNRSDTTSVDSDETKNINMSNTKSFTDRKDTTTFDLSENTDSTNETERSFTNRKDSRTVAGNGTETIDTEDLTSYRDRKDVTTFGKVTTHEARLHGNIGVTTSMSMQQEEIVGRKFDLLNEIVDLYAMRICY